MFTEEKRQGEAIQHPSKQGLLEFVKGKRPFEHYNWTNQFECACGQYADSVGLKQEWLDCLDRASGVWNELNRIANPSRVGVNVGSFGALRKKLEALV